jgi:hypothetical protein
MKYGNAKNAVIPPHFTLQEYFATHKSTIVQSIHSPPAYSVYNHTSSTITPVVRDTLPIYINKYSMPPTTLLIIHSTK